MGIFYHQFTAVGAAAQPMPVSYTHLVCALSAAEARTGGIRVAGQDLGRRIG